MDFIMVPASTSNASLFSLKFLNKEPFNWHSFAVKHDIFGLSASVDIRGLGSMKGQVFHKKKISTHGLKHLNKRLIRHVRDSKLIEWYNWIDRINVGTRTLLFLYEFVERLNYLKDNDVFHNKEKKN